jgi:hypothetical protein
VNRRYEALRGEGFPQAVHSMSGGLREQSEAKPSGFFFDKRSDQIEQSLGGGF